MNGADQRSRGRVWVRIARMRARDLRLGLHTGLVLVFLFFRERPASAPPLGIRPRRRTGRRSRAFLLWHYRNSAERLQSFLGFPSGVWPSRQKGLGCSRRPESTPLRSHRGGPGSSGASPPWCSGVAESGAARSSLRRPAGRADRNHRSIGWSGNGQWNPQRRGPGSREITYLLPQDCGGSRLPGGGGLVGETLARDSGSCPVERPHGG